MFPRRRLGFSRLSHFDFRSSSIRGVVAPAVPADYVVTNNAQWTAALAAAAAASVSKIIEISGTNFTRLTITGDFTGKPLTIRGADSSAEFLGMHLNSPLHYVTWQNLKMSRPQEADCEFWLPRASTVFGLFTQSGLDLSHFTFDGVTMDGGLPPVRDGGWCTTDTTFVLRGASDVVIRNCLFKNVFSGIYLDGCQNVLIENNEVRDRHADAFNIANAVDNCENIIIRNNHTVGNGNGFRFHMDWFQPQPANNAYRTYNILFEGNTYSPGSGAWVSQADYTLIQADYTPRTTSFTVTNVMHCEETRCSPAGGGSMTVTLPSAVSAGKRQFCFRQNGAGTVNFTLTGADTYLGGLPSALGAVGAWATFVSDGVSQWRKIRPGLSNWHIERRSSITLSTIEEGKVTVVDATDGNVTLTLPAGATTAYRYTIIRIDTSANTVTLAKTGGDTISLNGASPSSVNFVFGYSINIAGVAGVWTATENSAGNQGVFGNAHLQHLHEAFTIRGNIIFQPVSTGIKMEDVFIPDYRVYNNTLLPWLADDMNGDGVVSWFEGNNGLACGDIILYGYDALGWNNFTTGPIITTGGTGNGVDIGSIALNLTNKVGMEAVLDDYFNGTTRAAYRPNTRAEVIAAALAKSGGALAGTYKGACGTTAANGYYNFDTGVPNTITVVPTLASSAPADGETIGDDAAITLTLDQFPSAGTGVFTLRNVTDSSTIETFNIATGVGSATGSIVITGRNIVITPGAALPDNKNVAVWWDAGVVNGHYGTPIAANSSNTLLNFTIDADLPTAFTTVDVSAAKLSKASALTGFSTAKSKIIFATNIVRDTSAGDPNGMFIQLDGGSDFTANLNTSSVMLIGLGPNSLRVPNGGPASSNPAASACETIIMVVDLAAASAAAGVTYYRNGTKVDPATYTNIVWNAGGTTLPAPAAAYVFDRADNSQTFDGKMGFLYFDIPSVLPDLTNPAVEAAFLASFQPGQIIPSSGNSPTGAQPLIFQHGDTAFWNNVSGNNLGSGGFFTVSGTIASPSNGYGLFGSRYFGPRYFGKRYFG